MGPRPFPGKGPEKPGECRVFPSISTFPPDFYVNRKSTMSKSTEENKKLVRRFIEEIINTGDVADIGEIVSEDYVEIHDGVRHAVGIERAKAHILGVRQTYSNLRLTVEQQIAEGDYVATCITARGIHTGSWLGMEPTGKPVIFAGVKINKVVDGKIVEHGGAANMFGPLLEIGAIRVVGPEDK